MTGKSLRDELKALIVEWRARAARLEKLDEIFARDICDEHADEVEQVLASPQGEGWRDIESAPKDGAEILAWATNEDAPNGKAWVAHWSTSAWYGPAWIGTENRSDTEYLDVLAWQPLPAPPEIPKAERQEKA